MRWWWDQADIARRSCAEHHGSARPRSRADPSITLATHKTLAVGVRYTNIGGEWHDALGQAELRDGGNTSAFSPNP